MEGSEHTIDGTQSVELINSKNNFILHYIISFRHPMEMHVVYFKSCYLTQEAALREKDGVVIVAYICKVIKTNILPSR